MFFSCFFSSTFYCRELCVTLKDALKLQVKENIFKWPRLTFISILVQKAKTILNMFLSKKKIHETMLYMKLKFSTFLQYKYYII